jgi:hypothetical protein
MSVPKCTTRVAAYTCLSEALELNVEEPERLALAFTFELE